eukprot:TRINITY_DN27214_c0_g1_i1.p1 TRINITY_DN27214_c0_g1~~TRINITY_DN27214_c0_g1_i1.p1  ORF type:complete len:834 (-),score=154.58 TRINITY_DN27214_c0_g1_i1:203-2704(-)
MFPTEAGVGRHERHRSSVPLLTAEQEEESSAFEVAVYNKELHKLVDEEAHCDRLEEQLRQGEKQLSWAKKQCKWLGERHESLQGRLAARDKQRGELLLQASSLRQTARECGERAAALREELGMVRRRRPGATAAFPRLGEARGAMTTAEDVFVEVQRALAGTPGHHTVRLPRLSNGSVGESGWCNAWCRVCSCANCAMLLGVPSLLPCVAWAAAFGVILDTIWNTSDGSPPHWLLFAAAIALSVMCLLLLMCVFSDGARGGQKSVLSSRTVNSMDQCCDGSNGSDSEGGDSEIVRLLGGTDAGVCGGARRSRNDGGGSSSLGCSSGKVSSNFERWRCDVEADGERSWKRQLTIHAQVLSSVLALLHVTFLGLFAAAYPNWCSIVLLRLQGIQRNAGVDWFELGLECGSHSASNRHLGLRRAAEFVTWLVAVLPVWWVIAWFGVARNAGVAEAVRALLSASASAAGVASQNARFEQGGSHQADQPLRGPPESAPELATPVFDARVWWRFRHRADVLARFWTDFRRVSLVLTVDALDCMDLWLCAALNEDLVAASGARADADGGGSAAGRLLYSDDRSPGLQAMRRLRLACLVVALCNLARIAVTHYVSDVFRYLFDVDEDVVTSPEERHDMFIQFLRGKVSPSLRNTRTLFVASASILLVDAPLLVLRVVLAQMLSIAPSPFVTKNIVGLACHGHTALRFIRWRRRFRVLRRRHASSCQAVEGQIQNDMLAATFLPVASGVHDGLRGPREAFFELYEEDIGGPFGAPRWNLQSDIEDSGTRVYYTESDEDEGVDSESSSGTGHSGTALRGCSDNASIGSDDLFNDELETDFRSA